MYVYYRMTTTITWRYRFSNVDLDLDAATATAHLSLETANGVLVLLERRVLFIAVTHYVLLFSCLRILDFF